MCKSAYWSLICYPLALAFEVAAVVVMSLGHSWQAVGLSVLGLHMLLWQIIWAFFTFRPADLVFTGFCVFSTACVVAVIVGSFSMVATNWLFIGSVLALFAGRGASSVCEYLFKKRPV